MFSAFSRLFHGFFCFYFGSARGLRLASLSDWPRAESSALRRSQTVKQNTRTSEVPRSATFAFTKRAIMAFMAC
eukprot:1189469-Prorocentrum_minimum.AAC.7